MNHDTNGDAEDLFANTRMSFGDHLEELRWHLWRALIGFGIIMILVFVLDGIGWLTGTPIGVGKPVMDFISRPVEQQLQQFYDRRVEKIAKAIQDGDQSVQAVDEPRDVEIDLEINHLTRVLAARLGLPAPAGAEDDALREYVRFQGRIPPVRWSIALHEAQRLVGKRPSLKTMSLSEGMMVYFKVALVCGVVLGSPWIFWQIWAFVAAGLYPHERRYVHKYLPFSLALFLAGVLLCQFFVIPRAIEALLWFNEWLNWEPDLRLNEWLGFAVLMPLVFGVSFQTPLVMLLLERLGLATVTGYQRKRRLAWFLLAIFSAVVTPSTEVQSLLFLWVPMTLLYELGIVLCRMSPRRQEEWETDVPAVGPVVGSP